ncbi:glutathione S-transferase family protein [Erythrobacter crassostreae]|uniref:Glutathione S-transferase family protein n=1 Tax=Erythrobacter crassostreae TaxID=2828328 RepID=A0A9X1F2Y8_9SPHN|nr:glutathione S-transferase family protein [Erythrobacter crassostrea]MBV7258538.1 glutathione S-transferase family protein [Erythrobacter crassostrea]
MSERYTLHEDPCSGNCYKIKLTAALLSTPLETKQYDILAGETRTEDFLENVNLNGRIPVLQIDGGGQSRFLPESNAVCWYLAHGSRLIPQDRLGQADMLRWMFFEQYNHEPNLATLRFWMRFVGEANLSDRQRAQIETKRSAGNDALRVMDEHLAGRDFLSGDSVSLADIALFPYTHLAEEGGFALRSFRHLRAWITRIEALPGFAPMA